MRDAYAVWPELHDVLDAPQFYERVGQLLLAESEEDIARVHAHAAAQAIEEGIPLLGFFHWSLMDNFEWAEGFDFRFGLYQVDYETMARKPTSGVAAFQELSPRLQGGG